MEQVKSLVSKLAKKFGYVKKEITNYRDYPFYMVIFTKKDGGKNYLNIAVTETGVKILHFLMSKYYMCHAAKEEWAAYPEGYQIYQDDKFSYIVTDYDEQWVENNIGNIRPIDDIYLSPKTHAQYEKVSDFIKNYDSLRKTVLEISEKEPIKEYLSEKCTYEQQIIEPIIRSVSLFTGLSETNWGVKNTPYGMCYQMAFWNDNLKSMIVVFLTEDPKDPTASVSLRMLDKVLPDGRPIQVPIPDNIPELCKRMQIKTK